MFIATLLIECTVPASGSLKSKRAVVKHVVETLRSRHSVAAAEVDYADSWQRCAIGIAAVSSTHAHVVELLESAERFVRSEPRMEIGSVTRKVRSEEEL